MTETEVLYPLRREHWNMIPDHTRTELVRLAMSNTVEQPELEFIHFNSLRDVTDSVTDLRELNSLK